MTAAVHELLPFDAYLDLPGESASGIKDVLVSPLLYQWRREHGRPDKDAMRVGRAAHTAILEPHRFRAEYIVWTGGRRFGNDWNAFQVEWQSRTILTEAQHASALEISKAVRSHPIAGALLAEAGKAEVSLTWTHARTGLACKARLDWLCSALVDVKTCRDPSPAMFASQVARLAYHAQVAHYNAGLVALSMLGRPVKLIAVQNTPPWDVAVYDVPEDVLVIGEQQAETALDRIAACRTEGRWPGMASDGEITLRLPAWAVPHFDDELTWGGEALFGVGA